MVRSLPIFLALGLATAGYAASSPHYAVTASLAMPDGGWDLVAVAPSTHQVFVARTTNVTAVDVADAGKARTLGQIERGYAALPIPGSSGLLVTSGKDNSVYILDQQTGRQSARLAVGANPDAAIIDPRTRRAFVMNAKDGTVSVVDLAKIRVLATVQLKPGLELPAITPQGVLFVNNEEANEIESIDLQTLRPGAAIPLPGCEGPTGLAFDPVTARLISSCANGKAAIIDARSGRETALLDIGRGPDGVILDPSRRTAFIPCGRDGILDVIALDGPGGPKVIEQVETEYGARTGALDPTDGALYLPTASFARAADPGSRPAVVAGTAHLLVVKPR